MALNFNSLNPEIFTANSVDPHGNDNERANIIASGRLLMVERNGRDTNSLRILEKRDAAYTPVLPDMGENSYAETNRNTQHKMMLYCAKLACASTGEVAPADYAEFMKRQRRFLSDRTFLRALAGIVQEVIQPVLPITMSNGLDWLADFRSVPLGQTLEIEIGSNDIFLFEDDSWGASRSKPSNYLYSKTVTLNPTLRTAKATIKWYQLVGNDADLGKFFNSFAAGMYSKIVALWTGVMTGITTGNTYIPTSLQFTNNTQNWVTAAERLALANGTTYSNAVAIGRPSALSQVLPSGLVNASNVNLDAAISTMLGLDYTRYGFMGEYMGVRLHPITGAIVPGTQNTTITDMVPNDKIFMLSSSAYKPVVIGMEEGGDIQIVLDPSETADMTIDIMVSMSIAAVPVLASKMAVINL